MGGRPGRAPGARGTEQVLGALRRIGRDRRAGAHELSRAALRALEGARVLRRPASSGELRTFCREVADRLGAVQPAMGVFRRWSEEWREFGAGERSGRLSAQIDRWLKRWKAQLRNETPALVKVVRDHLPPGGSVLTISRSASVYRSLAALPRSRRPWEVVVLESRPGGEGRALAHDLRLRGFSVRLVPDREGRAWAGRVVRVLIGADTIYADGSVAHKVGTRSLALAAHRHKVPLVVVSGVSKGVAESPPRRLPPLFDLTPAWAVHEYWTDRGTVKGGRWRTRPV